MPAPCAARPGASPIAFSAKYAFTLADRLNAPSWNSGQPPCAPWIDAQVDADLRLQRWIDAVEEVLQQHVFRRDRRVRLQLEQPVPVGVLLPRQSLARPRDRPMQCQTRRDLIGDNVSPGIARPQAASSTSAAARPDLMAPSIVPGNPVAVQSPASTRLAMPVRAPGRSRSCSAVAAKVARRSFTTRHGGISPARSSAACTSGQTAPRDRLGRAARPSGWPR